MKENQKLKEQFHQLKEADVGKRKKAENMGEREAEQQLKKAPVKMPEELWGLNHMKNKEQSCFGFNTGKCDLSRQDSECERGRAAPSLLPEDSQLVNLTVKQSEHKFLNTS